MKSSISTDLGVLLPDEHVFVSLDDAPLDVVTIPDGDDSVLHATGGRGVIGMPVKLAPSPLEANIQRTLVVPLPRTLKLGMKGVDVMALQRALSRAGYRKWGVFTQNFGDGTYKQLKKFQSEHGLKSDGEYGPATHLKLKQFYDAYGASLMAAEMHRLKPDFRTKIVASAIFGYNNRWNIHYTQSSLRMYGVRNHIFPPNIPRYEDCSSFATWTYYTSGAADPNNLNYSGQGYTGTLSAHGARVDTARAGDLCFYGYGGFPFKHVTVAISSTRCVSHGSEIGPLLVEIRYRGDYYETRSYV